MSEKNYRCFISCIITGCLICGLLLPALAQSPAKEFQESRDDFLKVLGQKPTTKERQSKGLSKPKGPAEIVPDNYDKLIENPTTRSLILFDFDSDRVKEESYPILRNLAEVLQKDLPEAKLVVAGHTDSVGTDEYNMGLSKRRAQAVKYFLVSAYKIDAARLLLKWYGERQPFIQENTEDGRNRRVEFIRVE